MKWIALSALTAAGMFLVLWLRENPKSIAKILMLMGFLPVALTPFHLYMAGISWPDWGGYVKGAEVSVLDAVALAVYLALPGERRPLPFRIAIALYLTAVSLSVFQASFPTAAMFYVWQVARIFLVYAAVARACAHPGYAPALLKGMAAGLVMQAGLVVWERFGLGVLQAGGTAGHQNLLGLMTHFAAFPIFALLLARQRGWVPPLGTVSSVIIQALTTSRATVGLAAFGYFAVFALAALRRWTPQTTVVLLIGVVVAGAVTPLLMSSFERRFAIQGVSDYDERAAFRTAALTMISDHPWGVGANHYVFRSNVDGYNTKAGVAPTYGSLSTNVHNVYLLVAAETGYFGLATFVLLILSPMIVALRCGLRHRADERGEILIGLGIALLVVYLHSFFEWVSITFEAQYLWALDVGMVAGLAQQLGWRRRAGHRSAFQGIRVRIDGVPTSHASDNGKRAFGVVRRNGSNWQPPERNERAGTSSRLLPGPPDLRGTRPSRPPAFRSDPLGPGPTT